MLFNELNLHPKLYQAIESLGFSELTPIQTQSIPHILIGKDVAGLAQTGTGKTGAFLIPIIDRILKTLDDEANLERRFASWSPQSSVLILAPTRELAEQIFEVVQALTKFTELRSCVIYGGTGYEKQHEALKANPHFVVATPGRLIDLFKDHLVDFKQVKAIIFDEADRMFDMGFKDDMKYILERIPRDRQFLVFSATLNFDVLNTAYHFGSEPVEINISRDQATADHVKDSLFHVGQDEKPQHLLSLIKLQNAKQIVVFTNFKNQVESISNFLIQNKIPALTLSSLMSQSLRNKVIQNFKSATTLTVLVATDVAARGLDVQGIDLVVNYELPNDSETYVHRIGRTGRAGTDGTAFSLVSDKDVDALYRVEEYLKRKIEIGFLETKDLVTDFIPYTYRPYCDGGEREDRRFSGSFSSQNRSGGGGSTSRGKPPHRDSNRNPKRGGGDSQTRDFSRGDKPHRPYSKAAASSEGAHNMAKAVGDKSFERNDRPHKFNSDKNKNYKGFDKNKRPQVPHKPRVPVQPPTLMVKITKFFKSLFGS